MPSKLPANDSLPPLLRAAVMSTGLLAFGLVVALSLPTPRSGTAAPEATKPEPVLTAEKPPELCQQLFEEPKGVYRRHRQAPALGPAARKLQNGVRGQPCECRSQGRVCAQPAL
jgi:hypothetical protein